MSQQEDEKEDSGNSNNDIECSLEEIAEIVESIGPERAQNIWQCGECGKIYDVESDLNEHMKESHAEKQVLKDKVVFLIPENCKECKTKESRIKELEESGTQASGLRRSLIHLKEDMIN